jgi:hypothetical protein
MALKIEFYDGREPIITHHAIEFMTQVGVGFVCVIRDGPDIIRTVPAEIVQRIDPVDVNIAVSFDGGLPKAEEKL